MDQALEPGASVARVARAHGLNANVVFHWRRLYSEGKLAVEPAQAMKLLPVSIAEREVVMPSPEEVVTPSCGSVALTLDRDRRALRSVHVQASSVSG